jgi:hypothetical protein
VISFHFAGPIKKLERNVNNLPAMTVLPLLLPLAEREFAGKAERLVGALTMRVERMHFEPLKGGVENAFVAKKCSDKITGIRNKLLCFIRAFPLPLELSYRNASNGTDFIFRRF